jgi:hypothetical protein
MIRYREIDDINTALNEFSPDYNDHYTQMFQSLFVDPTSILWDRTNVQEYTSQRLREGLRWAGRKVRQR